MLWHGLLRKLKLSWPTRTTNHSRAPCSWGFMETSQFSAAANAYKQAVLLSGGNPVFIMAYSRALIMEADGEVTDDAKKSLDIVLVLQPENEEARYFMAVRKLQSGNSREAMTEMKELYKSLADGSPLKAMIDRQIGRQSDSN